MFRTICRQEPSRDAVFRPGCGQRVDGSSGQQPPFQVFPVRETLLLAHAAATVLYGILALTLWAVQAALPWWAFEKARALRFLAALMIAFGLVDLWNLTQTRLVQLRLSPDRLSGIWIQSRSFLTVAEPFVLALSAVEGTRLRGNSLELRYRGRWRRLPIECPEEAQKLTEQYRFCDSSRYI